jgi:hypothetical protein
MNDERIQAEIQAAINELVTSGAEIGLQVAVIKNGRVAADVRGLPPGTTWATSAIGITCAQYSPTRSPGGSPALASACSNMFLTPTMNTPDLAAGPPQKE